MSGGRTVWRAKDAGWWRRERIVALGEEFGAEGPSVIDWLESEAKAQNASGYVKTGRRAIARGCFVDLVTVGHVLSRSVTLGLLEDFTEADGLIICRISGWQADQERALAATRKAKQRAATPIDPGDPPKLSRSVTPSHAESRSVTECPPTGQDSITTSSSGADRADKENEKATDEDKANCRLFAELALGRNEKVKIPQAGTGSWAAWLREMRLLRTSDGNSSEDIAKAIRWVFTDPSSDALFWGTTIQAPSGLREHFPKVWAKMQAQPLRAVPAVESSAEYVARRRGMAS